MKPSLTKIVDVILKRIEALRETTLPESENGIRTWLKGQGYNKRDIEAAMKLVRPRVNRASRRAGAPRARGQQTAGQKARIVPHTVHSVRLLAPHEEQRLTPEARNALARLELYGLIDPYERELILDRLNHFDGEVGLEELDYLLGWVVCGIRDVESQQTIYSVLEGREHVFH